MLSRRSALAGIGFLVGERALAQQAPGGSSELSAAERLIFVEPHLQSLRPPRTLRYRFTHRASAAGDSSFEDDVSLTLKADASGQCCAVQGRFLSGAREVRLPDVESAQANPVTMFFLEREVRELQRLTGGQAAHFRRRIRLALAQAAAPREAGATWRGKPVVLREIEVAPYLDDPQRHRFEKQAATRYRFTLSEAVPGGVWRIEAELAGERTDTLSLVEAP